MKKSIKNIFFGVAALSMAVAVGAGLGLADKKEVKPVEAAVTSTTDATGIYYNDAKNWCFRSVHMYNVSYAEGYTYSDFETFLTGFYGAKISSWSVQGTTRGWGLNGGTSQDYMICDGGEQQSHKFEFPWWVSHFKFQIVNNDNWLCNWEVKSDWGIHTKFDLTVDGTNVTTNSMNAFTYGFPGVTISKVAVDSSTKQVISGASLGSDIVSKFDKYPNGKNTPDDPSTTIQDYLFKGWYTDQNLTTAFSKKFYTADATIYAKYDPVTTVDAFIDVYDWSAIYLYTFETVGGENVEYYGSFPGKQISLSDSGLTFRGGHMQKVSLPYSTLANAGFIYSDGTDNNKSTDQTLTANAYYYHNGSAWTKDSSDIASAASFVWDLNVARLAVTPSGSTKAFSICGLSAQTWVNRYSGLTSAAKALVDAATIFTYKDAESTGADTTVTYAKVMEELTKRAGASGTSISYLFGNGDSTQATVIIVTVTALAALAVGGYFLLKKKRA